MRTDMQIQADVLEQLRWSPRVTERDIAVSVRDGIVTLGGTVGSYVQRIAAEREVEHVAGVKAIANDIQVKLPGGVQRSDAEIAHAAVTALLWDIEVPEERIRLKVDDGFVTLSGNVEWNFQRSAVVRAIRNLSGVKGVINQIAITPRAEKQDVAKKIKDALVRSADLESARISVETTNGVVTLKGKVRSYAERAEVERAAWSAPGVTQVNDLTTVSL
jgi:osmotically-inducible protein OsmY